MIVYKYLNNYFCNSGDNTQLFPDLNKMIEYIDLEKPKFIFTNCILELYNDSGVSKFIDFNILFWLKNNLKSPLIYSPQNIKDVYVNILTIKTCFDKNYLDQAILYTKYLYKINKLFKFSYNEKEVFILKEKHFINLEFNKRLTRMSIKQSVTLRNTYDWLDKIDKGIYYDFVNATGRIYPKGFDIIKFDNKYLKIFKTDDWKYYKVDFKCFYPRFIRVYLKKDEFIENDFYCKYYKKLKYDNRKMFKNEFNKFLNGGRIYNSEFLNEFKYLTDFKDSLQIPFLNCFNRKIYCKDYQKLGYLISSTAEDCLKQVFSYLYDTYKDQDVIFIYLKYDELFLKTKRDIKEYNFLDLIKNQSKGIIDFNIEEV